MNDLYANPQQVDWLLSVLIAGLGVVLIWRAVVADRREKSG